LYKQNHTLGILLSCAGYSVWVVGDTFVKLAGETLPILEIMAIELFISSLFTIVLASLHGGAKQLRTKRPALHIWRSIFVMGGAYGSVAGVIYLSLADFYTIVFTSPLLLTALGSLILKEKVDRGVWLAIIFGFLGVVVAVQFSGLSGQALSWQGILATTLCSCSGALAMLMARGAVHENNYALTLWPLVATWLVSTIAMLTLGSVVANPTGVIYAIFSGILGGAGSVLTNASLRVAPVAVVSPYHYTQIIGGAAAGSMIWHRVPAFSVIIGAVMVVASGLYVLRVEKAKSKVFADVSSSPSDTA
jgi:drug/metabolite transporter (DMT)-like permease